MEQQAVAAIESELVDLTGVSLEALRGYDGTALSAALVGLLRRLDAPNDNVAGHNS